MNARHYGIIGFCVVVTGLNVILLPSRFIPRVPVENVIKAPLPHIVRASATVQPKKMLVLKAEIEGPVISKSFKEDQPIQKGQLLVELGRDKIRLDYQKQVIAVENAKADLLKAKREVRVQKELYRSEAVARSSVEDAQRAAVHAEQDLKNAQEALREGKRLWEKNKIYAPFAGIIAKDSLGEEPSVTVGKEIATLADNSEMTIVANVDEFEIQQIRLGQGADVQLQAFGDTSIHAKVINIGSQAQADTLAEVPVTLEPAPTPGFTLRPNMTAVTRIVTGSSVETLSVPLTALFNQNGENKVWVVSPSGRLKARTVTVGQSNPERVEITQGLSEGENVCMTADAHFADGMRIRPGLPPIAPAIPSGGKRMSQEEFIQHLQQMPGGGPPPEVLEKIRQMQEAHKKHHE